ncbi:hypothetical protein Nmel_014906 [Mimus melanotis]
MEVGWGSIGDGVGQGPQSEVLLPAQFEEEMEIDMKIDRGESMVIDIEKNGKEEIEMDVEKMEEEMEVEMEDYVEDMEVDKKGEQEDIVLGWTPTPGRHWPCPAHRQSGAPAARLGLGWVGPLRDTVPRGSPGFWWHKHHPQPALCLLWATLWAPQPGGSPQPQPGSVLAAEPHCASMCQPGGTGNSPLCLTAVTLSLAFLPGPMETPGRDATLLHICRGFLPFKCMA